MEKKKIIRKHAYFTLVCAFIIIFLILGAYKITSLRDLITGPFILSIILFFSGVFVLITKKAVGWKGSMWEYQWAPYQLFNNLFGKTKYVDTKHSVFYSGVKAKVAGFVMMFLGLAYISYRVIKLIWF